MAKNEFGTDLETAISELQHQVETAKNFIFSEFEEDWAKAEKYFAGEVDILDVEGRSKVVKTEVRDAIRNVLPNIMRAFLHSRKPVEYLPSVVALGDWSEQQSLFAAQVFWKSDGYRQLLSSVNDALKLKIGPMKVYWEEDPLPTFFYMTKVTADVIKQYEENPNIDIEEVVINEDSSPMMGDLVFYDIKGYEYKFNGNIVCESVPPHEFFIDRNSNGIADAEKRGVHGHSRDVTVGEAIDLGLNYDDWLGLDAADPEESEFSESGYWRRGYQKDKRYRSDSDDLLKHQFLLTEVYASYDLKGTGRPQLYKFWLGGASYEYIDHDEVDESDFVKFEVDPQPHSPLGRSLADIVITEQDTSTSLLRATVDNAHMANNPRLAADPVAVEFDDLMNRAIGAPIRKKARMLNSTIDTITIPFTGQGLLGLMEYLDKDTQEKVGVTKAAQGLDPNAMQSTDKEAVKNTIMLAQGQVELMVRNLVETGLIPAFTRILKLATRHFDPIQAVMTKGKVIPFPMKYVDTSLAAIPKVGLGTASPEQKIQSLGFVLQKQEQMMQEMGPDNPFTSFSQVYNTIEDILEESGLYNVGRYFNIITPDVERQLAEKRQKEQQDKIKFEQENKPVDPAMALVMTEKAKEDTKRLQIVSDARLEDLKLEQKSLKEAEELDIKRDELVQNRIISLLKIGQTEANNQIKREQDATEFKSRRTQESS